MGFASAGAADEDRVTLGVEEAAGGEFAHQSFIDGRVREDELGSHKGHHHFVDRSLVAEVEGDTVRLSAVASGSLPSQPLR